MVYFGYFSLVMVYGVVCQFRRGYGRGTRQGAGRQFEKSPQRPGCQKLSNPRRGSSFEMVLASLLKKGDVVLVEAGDYIPVDGEVIEGVASVDEGGYR